MITSNQLNLLITVCDVKSALLDKIPEKLHPAIDELLKKRLLKLEGKIVIPTNKGIFIVNAAKKAMNFNFILSEMNTKMLINLWHRLIETSHKEGIHLNVVFKNLNKEQLDYLGSELNKAYELQTEKEEIEKLSHE